MLITELLLSNHRNYDNSYIFRLILELNLKAKTTLKHCLGYYTYNQQNCSRRQEAILPDNK